MNKKIEGVAKDVKIAKNAMKTGWIRHAEDSEEQIGLVDAGWYAVCAAADANAASHVGANASNHSCFGTPGRSQFPQVSEGTSRQGDGQR